MKRLVLVVALVVLVALLASCAPGPNPSEGGIGEQAGFWQGLWHGAVALFTFVISLFNNDVSIYEVNNNGGWYDFGYILGIMMFWGGGSGGAAAGSSSRKRR